MGHKIRLNGIRTYEDLKAVIAKADAKSAQSSADHSRKLEEKAARKKYVRSLHVNRRGQTVRAKNAGVPAARFVSGGRVESNRLG